MPQTLSSDTPDKGRLRIHVDSALTRSPVENARIRIFDTGQPEKALEEIGTDTNGNSETVELPAPPIEYSMEPSENQPYSEYTFQIQADGFEPLSISGAELFSGSLALQDVRLSPLESSGDFQNYTIPAHTLFGNYPPKIAEAEIKPVNASGEIVLSRVVVPEYIVVHDGSPRDSTAQDYYIRYSDYIKNVASSEIYATWPRAAIVANVLAIMSFTLNRVYTEWYRNKGYSFTITSSTAFDHKWIPNRNIFESISEVVDEVFASYLSRPNVRQPILTQYCDGQRVSCPNWLSQWGSKYLGDQNYTPVEILRYYYGDDMYINSAEEISGIPASWPGETLDIGSRGQKVEQLQEQLNAISNNYPLIPKIRVDGIYGEETQRAVEIFQDIFGLPETGEVDYRTWYKVQEIYVGVTRIAELY
ncbi:peptidoglycan-binding protein [Lachnospiraceae bacterium Marseille-Q4251]|nr:peptidoglycan-binding protein [Lachnospiraceae bacterium Marseille-Q4251]